ncbi:MAG TPA: sugar phosphate isomerase/epimerase [Firmicutes bacterium]|nr:sugar phosphate isomerase/epimerase [Bacillota bacterium]
MKKAINYWSFPGGLEGSKDVIGCLDEARELGFDGIELCFAGGGALPVDARPEHLKAIRDHAKSIGIDICSVATGLLWEKSLTADNEEVRQEAMNIVERGLEIASALGADTLLVIPGAVDVFFLPDVKPVPYEVAYARLREAMEKLVPVAEKNKVSIALENVWNRFLLSPLEVKDFIDAIGSPYLGAYLDVGNVMLTGYPEQWIRILGKRIKKVHLKDFRRNVGTVEGFVDLLEGDVNWPAVIGALRETGYDGYLIAEMIPHYRHCPEVRLANASRAMDAILGL